MLYYSHFCIQRKDTQKAWVQLRLRLASDTKTLQIRLYNIIITILKSLSMRESPFLFGNKKKKGEALSKQTYEENPQKCQPFGRENPFLRKQPLLKDDWRHQNKHKKYGSMNRFASQNKFTYLPPSKPEIRQKLKQLDQQSRKRQIYEQEKEIFNEYGAEAFRFSMISTTKESFFGSQPKTTPKTDRFASQSSYYLHPQEQFTNSIRDSSQYPSIDDYLNYNSKYSKKDTTKINPQNKMSFGTKKQKKSQYSLHRSKSSSFNPYDSISYTSNFNGTDQIIQGHQLNIGNFETSEDQIIIKEKPKNRWQLYGSGKQNRILKHPEQFEYKNKTFHKIQAEYL